MVGPQNPQSYNRRGFLRESALWAVRFSGMALGFHALFSCKRNPAADIFPAPEGLRLFSGEHAQVLEAALEQLLPGNEPAQTPGARSAEVIRFVDRTLQNPAFSGLGQLVFTGVVHLQQAAIKAGGKAFHLLEPRRQRQILKKFQSGELRTREFDSSRFFNVLFALCLEGFFGAPRHGGNKGHAVWQSIGFNPDCLGPMDFGGH